MEEVDRSRGLKIGELASKLSLNPRTIRYYETIGLMPEPARTPAGYRLYTERDHDRLCFILKAKSINLSLEEIKEILSLREEGQNPCRHVLELVDRKIEVIDEQRRILQELRDELLVLKDEAATTMEADADVCSIIEEHELAHA